MPKYADTSNVEPTPTTSSTAASSNQIPVPAIADSATPCPAGKRDAGHVDTSVDMSGSKSQKIMSVIIRRSAADKAGEASEVKHYEGELRAMAERYVACEGTGEHFVHMRNKYSSNRDLKCLQHITNSDRFYKVNLPGKGNTSIITSSEELANIIEKAGCDDSRAVEEEVERKLTKMCGGSMRESSISIWSRRIRSGSIG